jgi:two-component system, NarL family, nitrate/nitrite response regulator NarL
VLEGNSTALIAQQLGMAEATAKIRLRRLFRKLRVENRTQAAVWALAICPKQAMPEVLSSE